MPGLTIFKSEMLISAIVNSINSKIRADQRGLKFDLYFVKLSSVKFHHHINYVTPEYKESFVIFQKSLVHLNFSRGMIWGFKGLKRLDLVLVSCFTTIWNCQGQVRWVKSLALWCHPILEETFWIDVTFHCWMGHHPIYPFHLRLTRIL